jgi:hypothetical protein
VRHKANAWPRPLSRFGLWHIVSLSG